MTTATTTKRLFRWEPTAYRPRGLKDEICDVGNSRLYVKGIRTVGRRSFRYAGYINGVLCLAPSLPGADDYEATREKLEALFTRQEALGQIPRRGEPDNPALIAAATDQAMGAMADITARTSVSLTLEEITALMRAGRGAIEAGVSSWPLVNGIDALEAARARLIEKAKGRTA